MGVSCFLCIFGTSFCVLFCILFVCSGPFSAVRIILLGPTGGGALFLGASRNINKIGALPVERTSDEAGQTPRRGLMPPDVAAAYVLSDDQRWQLESLKARYIDGDPTQVRDRLLELAEQYGADEVGTVTNCYAFQDRVTSYELTANAPGIAPLSRLAGQANGG